MITAPRPEHPQAAQARSCDRHSELTPVDAQAREGNPGLSLRSNLRVLSLLLTHLKHHARQSATFRWCRWETYQAADE